MRRTCLLLFGLLGACGGREPAPATPPIANTAPMPPPDAPPPSESERVLVAMEDFEQRMCACTDHECAKLVSDDMTRWSAEVMRNATQPMEMTEAEQQRVTAIGTRMAECMQRALGMTPGVVVP